MLSHDHPLTTPERCGAGGAGVSLLVCIACGHAWIWHEEHGCTELVDLDSRDGMAFCDCEHTAQCDGCTLTSERTGQEVLGS